MKNWRCWFRSHQWESVGVADMFVVPTMGLQTMFKPDPSGDYQGCKRCRTVEPKESVSE